MNIKILWLYTLVFALIFMSCDDSDSSSGSSDINVLTLISLGDSEGLNSGLPGELIRVEGSGLLDMDRIVFDETVDVIFNPALNSDVAMFFNVPFDEDKGSRFGMQEITFYNQTGDTETVQFDLVQPAPSIVPNDSFRPAKAVGGERIVVRGAWFFNVQDVTLNDESVGNFELISDTELSFIFPQGFVESPELTITTNAGSVSKDIPIEGGFITYLLTDFDGNGPIQGDWFSYGDNKFQVGPGLGLDGSNGAELIWDDTGTDEFTGSGHQPITPVTTGMDAENAFIVIDVNADGFPGTIFEFVLTDGVSNTWLAKAPPVEPGSGWQTIEVKLADFGFNFDPSNQGMGDPDPSTLTNVSVQISQEGGSAPVPSGYKFDNLRLKVLE